jgi:hypothetical protein
MRRGSVLVQWFEPYLTINMKFLTFDEQEVVAVFAVAYVEFVTFDYGECSVSGL